MDHDQNSMDRSVLHGIHVPGRNKILLLVIAILDHERELFAINLTNLRYEIHPPVCKSTKRFALSLCDPLTSLFCFLSLLSSQPFIRQRRCEEGT